MSDEEWERDVRAEVERVLPERIKARLAATGQTARAASLKAGLSADAIRMILNGKSKSPRTDTLSAIAVALDCDIFYLIGARDEPTADSAGPTAERQPTLLFRYSLKLKSWSTERNRHAARKVSDIFPLTSGEDVEHLELLEDDSFDLYWNSGTYLHVSQSRRRHREARTPKHGEIVIVERAILRESSPEIPYERTVRLVREVADGLILETASKNPELAHALRLAGPDIRRESHGRAYDPQTQELIQVVGDVLRAYSYVKGPRMLRDFTRAELDGQEREDEVLAEAMARIIAVTPEK
jgi:transcriptional regulator with XRE-family HTH domain